MPETNNQIEGSTLTNDQELYEHLNFSEEEIETDQQQKIGERIDVNDHILLDGMISNHQNEFSKLPDDIKIPSEKIRNIHDDNPMNKLLCLHKGKLYYIENLDPQKGEKKAYVIAEDVEYINGELTQGSKEKNSYQNLIGPVEMENNPSKDAQSLFVHSRVVYDIIKKDNEYKKAKKAERTARTITEPDATYIGENLKIGIPQRTASDLSVNVQLMVHKGKLYQLDTESSKSKLLADNIEEKEGIYYKRNSQGLRVDLFSPSNVTTVDTNNFIQRRWTREGKNRDRTATMYVDSLTLKEVSHKGKKAILITDNAHFQDGKLKLGDKVIADKLPKTSNKDAMIWSLSAENATKFLDIANINNFVQGRNLIDLTTPAKASHELGTSHIIQGSKSLEDLTGYTQPLPEPSTSNIAQGRNSLSNLIDLTTPAKASPEPGTSHIIQDSKSLEDLTKYKQLLPEPSTSNIAQDRNSLSNLIDLTTSAKASPKLNRNTQSNTLGHTQKRPAPQPPQKGSNEDPSR